MGFVKTLDEIRAIANNMGEFYNAEMLFIVWETKPEIIKGLLPRPLKPTEKPLVMAFIAKYPETNFGLSYLESALSIQCQFKDERGVYILSMPVDNDIAMAAGREFYGYPKKMANFQFNRSGNDFKGWTERRGIKFFEVNAKITGKYDDNSAQKFMDEIGLVDDRLLVYNFKHFPAPDEHIFDYNPRLIQEPVEFHPNSIESVKVDVKLTPSNCDPWAEVEIVKVVEAVYIIGNNTMLKGKVVAEVKMPISFAPFAFLKWDPY